MFDFSGQVVMVTGAAGNLGRAVAEAFLGAGARLVLPDRKRERVAELYSGLDGSPDHLLIGEVDLVSETAVSKAVHQALERFGRIDVLVNTAGGYRAGKPVHEDRPEDWTDLLDLNLRTTLNTCRAVTPAMIAQGKGAIINTASMDALAARPNAAAYSVSKTAVLRLTEAMAAELRRKRIRVNCILPGIIDTPQNRAAMPAADYSSWLQPEAIANVVVFLASDAAAAINGAGIPLSA